MRNLLKSLLMMFCCASMASAAPRTITSLTVITDPALMLPLTAVMRDYSVRKNVTVTLVSSEEKDAETLIGEGMEAHLLISADKELVERLQLRGLIDVFAHNPLVRTELVLVRRKHDVGSLTGQWTLANIFMNEGNRLPIFLLNPARYTEGARSIAALNANDVAIDSRVTVNSKNELIERLKHEDSAGILLGSDALRDPALTVVSVLPETQYEPINFMAVVLASESMPQARRLAKFLNDPEALKTFESYGFKRAN